MMALAIFLSYGLQFYVPMNIIGPWFRTFFTSERAQHVSDAALRSGLVFCTCKCSNGFPLFVKSSNNSFSFYYFTVVLAALVPNLGPIISLVGAVSSSTLALIFPPLIEIITFSPNRLGNYYWVLWKDIAIMVFGILGFIFGSYASIMALLNPTPQASI